MFIRRKIFKNQRYIEYFIILGICSVLFEEKHEETFQIFQNPKFQPKKIAHNLRILYYQLN